MKCPNCLSIMKQDALFTSIKYECNSLYCNLKEEHGWYSWSDFKNQFKHVDLDRPVLVEYINSRNSSGKLRIDNFNHFEYSGDSKFRMVEED